MLRSTFIILFVCVALAMFSPLITAFPFADRSILRRCFGSLCGACSGSLFSVGGCNGSPVGLPGAGPYNNQAESVNDQNSDQGDESDDQSGVSSSNNDASSITLNNDNSVEIGESVGTSEVQTGDEQNDVQGDKQGVAQPLQQRGENRYESGDQSGDSPSSNFASSITLNNDNTVQIGQPETSADQTESDLTNTGSELPQAQKRGSTSFSIPEGTDATSGVDVSNNNQVYVNGIPVSADEVSQIPSEDMIQTPSEGDTDSQPDANADVAGVQPANKRCFGFGDFCGEDWPQSPQDQQPQEDESTAQNVHTIVVDNNNNIQIQTYDQATVTAFETDMAEVTETISFTQDVPFTIYNTATEYESITIDNTVTETAIVTQVVPTYVNVLSEPSPSIVVVAPCAAPAPVCVNDCQDAIPAPAPVDLNQCEDATPAAVDSSYVSQL